VAASCDFVGNVRDCGCFSLETESENSELEVCSCQFVLPFAIFGLLRCNDLFYSINNLT
jgi:hypothetical protein